MPEKGLHKRTCENQKASGILNEKKPRSIKMRRHHESGVGPGTEKNLMRTAPGQVPDGNYLRNMSKLEEKEVRSPSTAKRRKTSQEKARRSSTSQANALRSWISAEPPAADPSKKLKTRENSSIYRELNQNIKVCIFSSTLIFENASDVLHSIVILSIWNFTSHQSMTSCMSHQTL